MIKGIYLVIIFVIFISSVTSRWIATTTMWSIERQGSSILVNDEIEGTCITTGTYGPGCAAPANAAFIPLATITAVGEQPGPPGCIVNCATSICSGYVSSTQCFCTSSLEIESCMATICGIPSMPLISLASQLCCNTPLFHSILKF